jgi:hypothetical protein
VPHSWTKVHFPKALLPSLPHLHPFPSESQRGFLVTFHHLLTVAISLSSRTSVALREQSWSWSRQRPRTASALPTWDFVGDRPPRHFISAVPALNSGHICILPAACFR